MLDTIEQEELVLREDLFFDFLWSVKLKVKDMKKFYVFVVNNEQCSMFTGEEDFQVQW
jgi:hypothetical protein